MDAAAIIRARLEALAYHEKFGHWGDTEQAGQYVVLGAGLPLLASRSEPVTRYAALMDPTVGEALANLLDALQTWTDAHSLPAKVTRAWTDLERAICRTERIEDAFDALRAAICRTERSEG